MCGSGSHYSRTIRFPQLSSLFLFSRFVYKCPRILLRNSAIPYNTSRPRFPSHLLAASDSSPIRIRILQQVRSSCSYVLCPHRQFRSFACSQFYSLILRPGTSACFFSLACLSFTVAGTPEHQCSLSVFVLVCSRRDAAAHQQFTSFGPVLLVVPSCKPSVAC